MSANLVEAVTRDDVIELLLLMAQGETCSPLVATGACDAPAAVTRAAMEALSAVDEAWGLGLDIDDDDETEGFRLCALEAAQRLIEEEAP